MIRRYFIVSVICAVVSLPASSIGAGGFDRAIEAALPRVVKLYGLSAGQEKGYGSGVLVSEDGLVLTVFSLLIDARKIRAVTADGTTYHAEVVSRDRERQLALLQLTPRDDSESATGDGKLGPFPFFDISHEVELSPGDWLVAAGNAFKVADGAEPVSIAHGIFSARTRLDARRRLRDFPYRDDVLVMDAITSNPGAPGSALVNLDGEFVGLIGREVFSNLTHTHFNFAMPREVLYDFLQKATDDSDSHTLAGLEQRSKNERDSSFDPGIRLSRVGYRTVLPFVEHVRAGSPAALAGVRRDDLILALNGRSVPDADSYDDRLKSLAPDEPIDVVIRRGKAILTIHIEPEKP